MTQADFLKVIGDSLTVTKTLGARMLSPQLVAQFFRSLPQIILCLNFPFADCQEPC